MADRNLMTGKQLRGLLRSLGRFNVAEETEAALAERDRPGEKHPAPYGIESFAAGDLSDEALLARIAAHVEECVSCRAEVKEFRGLMPPAGAAGADW
jgi:hypothetical protein